MFLMSNKIIVSDKDVQQKQTTRHVYEHTGYFGCGNGAISWQVLIVCMSNIPLTFTTKKIVRFYEFDEFDFHSKIFLFELRISNSTGWTLFFYF